MIFFFFFAGLQGFLIARNIRFRINLYHSKYLILLCIVEIDQTAFEHVHEWNNTFRGRLVASAFRQNRSIGRVNRESMRVYASNWSMPAPMLPFAGSSRGKLVTHICTEVYLSRILASDAYTARAFKDPAISTIRRKHPIATERHATLVIILTTCYLFSALLLE